mmetsp:Transcript_5818/g.11536  ORF Transcript_5818/g.11536 Transcript_5818/m.11536 type:complete len:209 (-) Transcript_5818:990-1616(-)
MVHGLRVSRGFLSAVQCEKIQTEGSHLSDHISESPVGHVSVLHGGQGGIGCHKVFDQGGRVEVEDGLALGVLRGVRQVGVVAVHLLLVPVACQAETAADLDEELSVHFLLGNLRGKALVPQSGRELLHVRHFLMDVASQFVREVVDWDLVEKLLDLLQVEIAGSHSEHQDHSLCHVCSHKRVTVSVASRPAREPEWHRRERERRLSHG